MAYRKTQAPPTGSAARFAVEWNLAFLLVATAAGLLFAAGYIVAGTIASGLCVAACVARYSAMRKQNRGFYGQEKGPADAG